MVLDKETWIRLPPETIQVISFSGLVGDGAPLIVSTYGNSTKVVGVDMPHSSKPAESLKLNAKSNGFSHWHENGNPFLLKAVSYFKESGSPKHGGITSPDSGGNANVMVGGNTSPSGINENRKDGRGSPEDDENEDLLADFIDEDSQLPSRAVKPRARSMQSNNEDTTGQTGSSLCLLRLTLSYFNATLTRDGRIACIDCVFHNRLMDKYAKLMQKLEVTNVEFFKVSLLLKANNVVICSL